MPPKLPRQRRAQVTREAVIIAAERVLERHGVAGLTTNRVAEVAGVSIGSLYQYFPNKQAIVTALSERYVFGFAGAVTAALEQHPGAPLSELIAAVTRAVLIAFEARPRIHAGLRALRAGGELEPLDRVLDEIAARVTVLVGSETRAFVIVHAVYGAIEAYAVRPARFEVERLGDELARMVARMTG
jgi:AcrR family transcriptional regulator